MPAERGISTEGAVARRAKQRPKQGYETVVPLTLALLGRQLRRSASKARGLARQSSITFTTVAVS
jgi:hypothetical protein